jgi:hypothetical protein
MVHVAPHKYQEALLAIVQVQDKAHFMKILNQFVLSVEFTTRLL